MKYCFNCNRITSGEPLFCNFCGRSYDVKLCPRKHPNPRSAQACSQCGSRELSTPQPKVPVWAPFLQFVLSIIPGIIVAIASLTVLLAAVVEFNRNPGIIGTLAGPAIALAILWWM
jgi:hypothetical protein